MTNSKSKAISKKKDSDVERHRAHWAGIAKKHGWYKEPFHVQVWRHPKTKKIIDSVSHKGLTGDITSHDRDDNHVSDI